MNLWLLFIVSDLRVYVQQSSVFPKGLQTVFKMLVEPDGNPLTLRAGTELSLICWWRNKCSEFNYDSSVSWWNLGSWLRHKRNCCTLCCGNCSMMFFSSAGLRSRDSTIGNPLYEQCWIVCSVSQSGHPQRSWERRRLRHRGRDLSVPGNARRPRPVARIRHQSEWRSHQRRRWPEPNTSELREVYSGGKRNRGNVQLDSLQYSSRRRWRVRMLWWEYWHLQESAARRHR